MKPRHRIPCLAIALSIGILIPLRPSFAAEETGLLPFLKIGRIYQIVIDGAGHTVKILEPAGGQWIRVEYLYAPQLDPTQKAWIIFANVGSVLEVKEPDKKQPEKKETEAK
jgi:hypothetical protein